MKKTYYIYHIPGVKIGMTKNLKERLRQQGYTLDDASILETHNDMIECAKRERELQKQYGYKVDNLAYTSVYAENGYKTTSKKEWKDIARMGGGTGAGGKATMAGEHGERIRSMGGSASSKGDKFMSKQQKTCEHCKSTTNLGNYTRWHGTKCKHKKEL